ncbi:mast cell protease 1A-like isoform X2 [Lampris incognitus]|uniref:mast cell protease 1A-like isoform X2 n=1 Tax=Lampris incognitus TaxID=2546036 RepID=UPI0024B516B2|nr:mast cell protease 1A-like isoform X2 [Lampris incognitus]
MWMKGKARTLDGAAASGIVGGRVAKPHSRPYMVSLQIGKSHTCGGILVRKDFVLTSAHCKHPALVAVLGAHNITKAEKSQQRIQVAEYHPHPNYTCKCSYDIMLLKLKTPAKLNKYVKTIDLPKKNGKIPANINCTVAGWGRTVGKAHMPASDVLKEAKVKIQFNFECKNKWGISFLSDQMICTRTDKKEGICQGDSGGPLLCNGKPQGLSAFTRENDCSNPNYPQAFMKIFYFISWIKKVMG